MLAWRPCPPPEGLVSIAARVSDAKVISHQQDEVGLGWGLALGLTQEQQQKPKHLHLPAEGEKGQLKDRAPPFLEPSSLLAHVSEAASHHLLAPDTRVSTMSQDKELDPLSCGFVSGTCRSFSVDGDGLSFLPWTRAQAVSRTGEPQPATRPLALQGPQWQLVTSRPTLTLLTLNVVAVTQAEAG